MVYANYHVMAYHMDSKSGVIIGMTIQKIMQQLYRYFIQIHFKTFIQSIVLPKIQLFDSFWRISYQYNSWRFWKNTQTNDSLVNVIHIIFIRYSD